MTDWATLESQFRRLVELDYEHRIKALSDIEAQSPAMAEQLRGMLEADEQPTLEIGERVQRMASSVLLDGELRRGDRIGPWSVIERIGRGGMGTVYKVERADDQFRQLAALKVVSNIADEATYDRFRRERQILAQLSHANIAGLIDGGVIDDGRPWLVMEFVEGMNIDRWCDHHRLSVSHRLRLFLQVLDAVSFAHRKLVLHKDIKFNNILVNDSGQVRLLDFGTASLLDDDSDSPEAITRIFALTPAFASPEQLRGDPLSTASDIYSLGVVLYCLLTGRLPISDRGQSPGEFEQRVSTQIPPLPSAAAIAEPLESGDSSVDQVARMRSTSPTRLRSRLRGDLDAIIMTCLRKEPDRRYSSVQMLAADIRAALDSHPVSARAESRLYRLTRFISGHRWPLAGGLGLVTVLAAGMVISITNYLEAEQRGRELEQVVDFQQRLIEAVEPQTLGEEALSWIEHRLPEFSGLKDTLADELNASDLGRALIDRHLLADATDLIDQAFVDSPSLGFQMHTTMARLYRQLDLHERMVAATRAAARMAEEAGDPVNALRMKLFMAGALARLEDHGGMASAIEDVTRRVAELDSQEERDHVMALALKLQGDLQITDNRPEAALDSYRASLERRVALDDELLQRVIRYDIATTLHRLGRLPQALAAARELEADWLEAAGPDHPRTQTARNLLATVLSSMGKPDQAIELQRAIHEYRQRELGEESQFTLVALNNIGVSHKRMGEFEKALEIFDRVYDMRRSLFGAQNSYTIATAMRRGEALQRLERLEEAEAVFIDVISKSEAVRGLERQGMLARLYLEEIRARRGQPTDPISAHQLARQLSDNATHWLDRIQPWQMLGRILAAAGDLEAADAALNRALDQQLETLGSDHPMIDETRMALEDVAHARRTAGTERIVITPGPGSF